MLGEGAPAFPFLLRAGFALDVNPLRPLRKTRFSFIVCPRVFANAVRRRGSVGRATHS